MSRLSTPRPLKLLSTNALRGSLLELLPAFERESGCRVEVAYHSTNQMLELIRGGEAADLLILSGPALDELASQGRVVKSSCVDLASAGIGVCVRKGAPRPDTGTLEAFKRALLDARSIAHTSTGQSGLYFSRLIAGPAVACGIPALRGRASQAPLRSPRGPEDAQ